VDLRLGGSGQLEAQVRLPAGIEGEFVWRDARRPLKPGLNQLKF
jgi:hypothetical protein